MERHKTTEGARTDSWVRSKNAEAEIAGLEKMRHQTARMGKRDIETEVKQL